MNACASGCACVIQYSKHNKHTAGLSQGSLWGMGGLKVEQLERWQRNPLKLGFYPVSLTWNHAHDFICDMVSSFKQGMNIVYSLTYQVLDPHQYTIASIPNKYTLSNWWCAFLISIIMLVQNGLLGVAAVVAPEKTFTCWCCPFILSEWEHGWDMTNLCCC